MGFPHQRLQGDGRKEELQVCSSQACEDISRPQAKGQRRHAGSSTVRPILHTYEQETCATVGRAYGCNGNTRETQR
jgi:hypothetical protein